MSTNRFAVESFMDEMELKYFCQEDESGTNWALFFGDGVGFILRLIEDGEFLLVRSLPLLQLEHLTVEHRQNLHRELLKRNDTLKLGHYSSDNIVVFETGMPIQDGELTKSQLRRLIGSIASEITSFKERLPGMLESRVADADPLEILMQRLIEGDHPNAA